MATSSPMPSMSALNTENDKPLQGNMLWFVAILLSCANFIAVLDMTIANVSVSSIAGNLGVTTSQGTWVITSYAVAEAITVPLTGWLAARFGAVRVFCTAMACFGICSAMCGFANSLAFLVVARVCQGLSGGPMMPLTQTLLLRIFPREKAMAANGLWAMTTLTAPVIGPILGGYICDNYHWSWIFFINVPIALVCSWLAWKLLKRFERGLVRSPIDVIGLVLMVVWIGAFQIMLDEGKDLDWFSSNYIVALAIIAAVGFAAFMIWELGEKHPIVNLSVFRHKGFSVCVFTISLAFGGYFAANVITPLWLQNFMSYTPTWSGETTAWSGVSAFLVAPLAAYWARKTDPRRLIFCGLLWLGLITFARCFLNTDASYWWVALPILLMGFGSPFFFVPLIGLALLNVNEDETASAAGLMTFLRTLSGAFATSLVNTSWEDKINYNHAELAGLVDRGGEYLRQLTDTGISTETARSMINNVVTNQSAMLATNQVMMVVSVCLVLSAFSIWLAPREGRKTQSANDK